MGFHYYFERSLIFLLFMRILICYQQMHSLQYKKSFRRNLLTRYLTTKIFIVGKKNGAEDWINDGCAEYEKRLTGLTSVETFYLKSDEDLVKSAKALKGMIFALDENGEEYSSKEFSKVYFDGIERGGSHISFLIGGFAGLPSDVKKSYPLISLSKMTWAHQFVRLLLTEQIYRSFEIRKGSSYHKE